MRETPQPGRSCNPDRAGSSVERHVRVESVDGRHRGVECVVLKPDWVDQSFSVVSGEPDAVCGDAEHSRHVPGSRVGGEISLVSGSIDRATHSSGLWRESLTPSAGSVTQTASAPARTLKAETGSLALTVSVFRSIRTSEARFCWPWSDRSWITSTHTARSSAAIAPMPSPGSSICPVTSFVAASTRWMALELGNPIHTAPAPADTYQGSGASDVVAPTGFVMGSIRTRTLEPSWPERPRSYRSHHES